MSVNDKNHVVAIFISFSYDFFVKKLHFPLDLREKWRHAP